MDHISFHVDEGEIFGFLGPNGAGKTTTIKMLTTLLKPSEGSASVAGHDIVKDPDGVRRSIGVVFQNPALDDRLTGRENLDYHGRIYGMSREERLRRIDEMLRLVGLEDKADVLVKNYSGGMKRRLELARGLMHSPKVLFLDEPTLGLDAQTRRIIWNYIKRLNSEEGITVFLTTHYMEEADYLCDRVAIIDRGRLAAMGRPEELKGMLGRDVIKVRCSSPGLLAERLVNASGIERVEVKEGMLIVGASRGERKIPELFRLAREIGIEIEEVSMSRPSLEDVFLYYTGRRIEEPQIRVIR